MPKVEFTIRLLDEAGELDKAELENLLHKIKLDSPDADIKFSKVTDTNDAYDSVKIVIETAVLGLEAYHIVRAMLAAGVLR